MNNDPFGLFIDLITFDQKLIKIENDIIQSEKNIFDLENEISNLNSAIEQYKQIWIDAHKNVDEKELKMKELDQQEKTKKQKLDSVQDSKEYNYLKKEIEKIKQQQYELEPLLIEFWNKSEFAKKEYESKKSDLEKKVNEINSKIEEKKILVKNLKNELSQLKEERAEKEKNVPEEWITKYNIMRLKVQNPVIQVQNSSCNACFYPITNQDLLDLKHKKLVTCKRCYRFLYL